MSIRNNIAARRAFTDWLLANQKRDFVQSGQVRSQESALESMDASVQRRVWQQGDAGYICCRQLLERIYSERGEDDATALLTRYGVTRMADLLPSTYQDFYKYGTVVLTRGLSPQLAWSLKNPPEKNRDRWLLADVDNDFVWEVRGRIGKSDKAAITNGGIQDVSGVEEWEQKFKDQNS